MNWLSWTITGVRLHIRRLGATVSPDIPEQLGTGSLILRRDAFITEPHCAITPHSAEFLWETLRKRSFAQGDNLFNQ